MNNDAAEAQAAKLLQCFVLLVRHGVWITDVQPTSAASVGSRRKNLTPLPSIVFSFLTERRLRWPGLVSVGFRPRGRSDGACSSPKVVVQEPGAVPVDLCVKPSFDAHSLVSP